MKIVICGDSTAAAYGPAQIPMTGWGQMLEGLLTGIEVVNAARGGRSTKSFIEEGLLKEAEARLEKGDLLLVQFAHNDASDLPARHTDPWTSFQANLSFFIDTGRKHDAVPVLMTPICRRFFADGRFLASHGAYPDAMRALALKKNAPLIDLYQRSAEAVEALGEEESKKLYLYFPAGVYPAFPEGKADDAHTSRDGALLYARMAAEEIRPLLGLPPAIPAR